MVGRISPEAVVWLVRIVNVLLWVGVTHLVYRDWFVTGIVLVEALVISFLLGEIVRRYLIEAGYAAEAPTAETGDWFDGPPS